MGRAWKMPLLSTLAALVILVHSAEEDFERDVSARMAGPPAPLYDQAWRAVEVDPMAQETRQEEPWIDTSREIMPRRRRKHNRKPKRRPQSDLLENTDNSAPIVLEENTHRSHPDADPNISDDPERPRRRRKRPEIMDNKWLEKPPEFDRPLRRRGQKRKRPFPKYRPKLVDDDVRNADERPAAESVEPDVIIRDQQKHDVDTESALEISADELPNKYHDSEYKESHSGQSDPESKISTEYFSQPSPGSDQDIIVNEKTIADTVKKVKNNGPIDPQTLKEILRKSNGSSLSEILQQNNLSLSDLLRARENSISYTGLEEKSSYNKASYPNKYDETEVVLPQKKITEDVAQETNADMHKSEILDTNEDAPKLVSRRRLPPGGRRRMRLKIPMRNVTMKFPITRESSVLNTRKQALLKRFNNTVRAAEIEISATATPEIQTTLTSTTESTPTTSTTQKIEEKTTVLVPDTITDNMEDFDFNSFDAETSTLSEVDEDITTTETVTETIKSTTTTEKPTVASIIRHKAMNTSELRRQALTNRLKRKRQKQKNTTTELTQEDLSKEFFGMTNLVSASEFIAKIPKTTTSQSNKDINNSIDESLATEATTRVEKTDRNLQQYTRIPSKQPVTTSTEETAKIEIAEILNDRNTGAKLSRILKERNMTFDELIEHRERGSSHVHLADIFHNASREPNPPEPFLSKSSIEPLAKETYPLRVLLEANHHDPAAKSVTAEANPSTQHANIPVVMDFRNNVNENSDNLDIVSMFKKLTTNDINLDEDVRRDVTSDGNDNVANATESSREARAMHATRGMVTLEDIFSILHGNLSETQETMSTIAINPTEKSKASLEEDIDGDGLIVLEDLQHLGDIDSNSASAFKERVEMGIFEPRQPSHHPHPLPSTTRSVTVATASIVGLTMVVFLLTYAAFKWRQQRNPLRKNSFCEERIPTPIFENRKVSKNNSSSRSISPMIPSSNIYTLSSVDSRNGKESPDYMWDSLRKPFQ